MEIPTVSNIYNVLFQMHIVYMATTTWHTIVELQIIHMFILLNSYAYLQKLFITKVLATSRNRRLPSL